MEDWEVLQKKIDGLLRYGIWGKDTVIKNGMAFFPSKVLGKSAKDEPNLEFWDEVANHESGETDPTHL